MSNCTDRLEPQWRGARRVSFSPEVSDNAAQHASPACARSHIEEVEAGTRDVTGNLDKSMARGWQGGSESHPFEFQIGVEK